MPGNIDKTRPEFEGIRSFVGTGVGTFPDILEEQKDLRQMMQEMINEALSNVVGATVIQDVPDQIQYNFFGGGVSQSDLDNRVSNIYDSMLELYQDIWRRVATSLVLFTNRINDLQMQIRDLQGGSGKSKLCRAGRTSQLNFPTGVAALVLFDTVLYDPYEMLDTDTSKIDIPEDGNYFIHTLIGVSNPVPDRAYYIAIKDQSGAYLATADHWIPANSNVGQRLQCSNVVELAHGDWLRVYFTSFSGNNNVDTINNRFTVIKIP